MHTFLIVGQSNAQGFGNTEGYSVLQHPEIFRLIQNKLEPAAASEVLIETAQK